MADTSPRHPYPGQQWKHGWIPVTADAKASKGKQGNRAAIKARLAEARESALSKSTSGAGASWAKGKAAPGSPSKSSSSPSKATAQTKAPASPAKKPAAKSAPKSASKPDSSATSAALDDAKAAMKAGQNGKAVNALTRAMKTASPDEKKAITKLRSDLAAKVMGKDKPKSGEGSTTKPQKEAPTPAEDDDDFALPAGVHGVDSGGNMLRSGDSVRVDSGKHDGKTGSVVGRNSDGTLKVNVGGETINVAGGDLSHRPAAKKDAPKAPAKAEAPKPAAKKEAPSKPSGSRAQQVADTQNAVRDAYADLASDSGSPVLISDIRKKLAGVPRDVQDEALKKLLMDEDVDLRPAAARKGFSQDVRDDAVMIGGEENDVITMKKRSSGRGSARKDTDGATAASPAPPKRQDDRAARTPEAAPVKATPAPTAPSRRPDDPDFSSRDAEEGGFAKNPYAGGKGGSVDRREGGKRVSDAEMEAAIEDVVRENPGNDGWVSMTTLRQALQKKGLTREQTDEVLKKMYFERDDFNMLEASIQGELTPQAHADAFKFGPQWQHQIRLTPRGR